MPTARFANSFWDKDLTGTQGYDILIKKMKDGRKVLDDFSDLIRQRAKIEEEYGRALIKLSTHSVGAEETGTLRQSLDDVKKELENIGNVHMDLSRRLLEDIEKNVRDFRERQKHERSKIDDRMKRCQRDKKTAFDSVIKTKRIYEQKCKEKDTVEENMEAKCDWTPKEEEKLRAKVSKSKTLSENADTSYQAAVKMLEDIRAIWEKEMENACIQFQSLEEERIKFLRNEAWVCTNLYSVACVAGDQCSESTRLSLEKCTEVMDIQLFIQSKQTGSERPAPVLYENYYHSMLPPEMHRPDHARLVAKISPSVSQPPQHSVSLNPNRSTQNHNQDLSGSTMLMQQRFPRYVKVAYPYTAQGPEELSLHEGDVIEILRIERKEWGYGQLTRNGLRGMFPLHFVVST